MWTLLLVHLSSIHSPAYNDMVPTLVNHRTRGYYIRCSRNPEHVVQQALKNSYSLPSLHHSQGPHDTSEHVRSTVTIGAGVWLEEPQRLGFCSPPFIHLRLS